MLELDEYEKRALVRILKDVSIDAQTGCWLRKKNLDAGGYGQFSFRGRPHRSHRISYQLLVGPIPEGLHIDHLCRVRACINPAHLEPVTPAENYRRSDVALGIRSAATTCRHGHEFSAENTYVRPGAKNRQCRACNVNRKHPKRKIAEAPRSHCKHGHLVTPANTYVRPDGSQECRECRNQHRAKHLGHQLANKQGPVGAVNTEPSPSIDSARSQP